jgi:hypothetical protein
MTHLVTQGNAQLLHDNQYTIHWKKTSEWADTIYSWIVETGQVGSVLTLSDIRDNTDLFDLPDTILLQALAHLESTQKCRLFSDSSGQSTGIKFF